ncbi:hypothetical protein ROHU_027233 [Labeo rohita]|uniref:Uncharacterized protein n=1 Tax=Labeo rohita TaxID=84645 RepID=A0A498MCC0_LABRO|nr:hypothetical protein ROHU_012416 [Labeo rohita]RXN16756.1 hypothetical protein ROHU_027233 [Labeo rohita]
MAMLGSGLPVRNEAAQAARICCVTGAWQREGSVGREGWHGSGTIPSWLSGVVCVPTLSFAPETPRGDNRPKACYAANGDTSPIAIFLTGISYIPQRSGRPGEEKKEGEQGKELKGGVEGQMPDTERGADGA